MSRELDDRQEALHRIDTRVSRPIRIEPSRHRWRQTRWQRFSAWCKARAPRFFNVKE